MGAYLFSRRVCGPAVFVGLYLFAGLAVAASEGNREFLFYGALMGCFIAIVAFMDRRVTFSPLVLWGLSLWGFLHLAGGLMPIPAGISDSGVESVLYNMRLLPWLPKFDQMVHAYGFGTCTVAAYESLSAHLGRRLPLSPPVVSIVMLTAMGLGAVNEIMEFIAVLLMPETNVGGYANTGWDLVSNATGATIAVLLIRLRTKDGLR